MADQVNNQYHSGEILALSEASNYLAVNLHKQLNKADKNVFFSPFSISTAMAMLFCGSQEETAKEMQQVLGYEAAKVKDDEDLKKTFQCLLNTIEGSQESYILATANSVLSHCEFSVKEEYKFLLDEFFKALLQEVDFKNETAKILQQINDWVSVKTNRMIPKLLDSLAPSTLMVLVNAVYFKGSWVHHFKKSSTFLQEFHNEGENSKMVDMMHLKKKFCYIEKENFQALELPYKGDEIAMMVLLPKTRNGLDMLEESLNKNFIKDLKKEMAEKKIDVALPKFKLEYKKFLKEQFQSLGVNKIFSSGAHFGGISDSGGLFISEIIHKAVLVVDEEGSEAAAATAIMMPGCAMPVPCPEFIVDRPFMFVIYNTKNNLILFMGRVAEL